MKHTKGERLNIRFNRKIKLEFHGARLTSDGGLLVCNLGNFLRRLVLPGKIKHLSLRSLLINLIKIGAKVLRRSLYSMFQMAEVAISKEVFAEILSRINRLRCCSLQ